MSAPAPGGDAAGRSPPRLGVIVPCRNEAAVIGRKLANLARLTWPGGAGAHAVLVVDDGSEDDTADQARAAAGRAAADSLPSVTVLANRHGPGKAGALATGLDQLGDRVELVLLTDADVVFREDALTHLASAFAADPRLGMACGSQEFVVDLADDGRPLGADGAEPVPAPGRYDRWTAAVRAAESRAGRLVSVHGQLLAWRRDLALAPSPGIAADDLDLMAQVRQRGLRVEKLAGARFLEVKTPAGPGRAAQERRRAAAYFQVVPRLRPAADAPLAERLHLAAYRLLPGATPWLVLLALAAGLAAASWWLGPSGLGIGLSLVALALLTTPGRRLARLLLVIDRARRAAARQAPADRWEMARG